MKDEPRKKDSRRVPFLSALYEQYLETQDSAAFISKTTSHYTQGTLQRLVEHDCPEVRRGAVLALGLIADYEANHSLGRVLHDDDRTVRMLAENGIRNVWMRSGNESQRQLLKVIVRLNQAQQFEEAMERATELIEIAPWHAEAWNQRAIASFAVREYADAIRDCHQCLEINPYHFNAAAGMGQAYASLGNHVSALESFRRALRLNPGLEGVRAQIARIARMVDEN